MKKLSLSIVLFLASTVIIHINAFALPHSTVIRHGVLCFFLYLIWWIFKDYQKMEKEFTTLKNALPICSWCRKIRTEKEEWITFEEYISREYGKKSTHGICPNCLEKEYLEINLDSEQYNSR
jgi:hypothetical protein